MQEWIGQQPAFESHNEIAWKVLLYDPLAENLLQEVENHFIYNGVS